MAEKVKIKMMKNFERAVVIVAQKKIINPPKNRILMKID